MHLEACEVPLIEGYAAGFSCTSYSPLNKDSKKNADAMQKNQNGDPEDGRVSQKKCSFYDL